MRILVAAAAIVLSVAVDMLAGGGGIAAAIAFYLPMVLAVTMLAGRDAGLAAGIASFVAAWYLIAAPTTVLVAMAAAGAMVFAMALVMRDRLDRMDADARRLNALVDAAAGIVVAIDASGRVLAPDPDLARITGLEWPHYAAEPWTGAVHPDDRDKLPRPPLPAGEKSHFSEVRLRNTRTETWRWHRLRAVPLHDDDGTLEGWACILRDIHDYKIAREQQEMLVGELRHRLKNLVTVIEALAKSSRRKNDADIGAFLERFLGRMHALSAAGDAVLAGGRIAIDADALARATLAPFMEAEPDGAERIAIGGPPLELSEQTGGALALAIHELATNALKYGALSSPTGRVAFHWTRETAEGGEAIRFVWKETGGPTPAAPAQSGFGTRVIKFAAAHESDGAVALDYEPEGLRCTIAFTMAQPPQAA